MFVPQNERAYRPGKSTLRPSCVREAAVLTVTVSKTRCPISKVRPLGRVGIRDECFNDVS